MIEQLYLCLSATISGNLQRSPVHNDELHGLVGQCLEDVLQVLHVVVLVVQLLGKGESSSVNDTGVVAVVADDVVASSYHHGNDSGIDREASREA